ncbi:uncharacterized protein LOC131678595 [Topomyia yanbarensis]|uniref:uncharacterized protein LOC131678595 n=1 Tax=Topomyia yanbarensis TaxID=2498891 RepID=UPI00273B26EA|nr:uncharacterized protein LOC131678595 [Topomyia yanbarensis]
MITHATEPPHRLFGLLLTERSAEQPELTEQLEGRICTVFMQVCGRSSHPNQQFHIITTKVYKLNYKPAMLVCRLQLSYDEKNLAGTRNNEQSHQKLPNLLRAIDSER